MQHRFASPPCWLTLAEAAGMMSRAEAAGMTSLVEAEGLMMSLSDAARTITAPRRWPPHQE